MKTILGIKVDIDDSICDKKNVIYLIEFNGTDKALCRSNKFNFIWSYSELF